MSRPPETSGGITNSASGGRFENQDVDEGLRRDDSGPYQTGPCISGGTIHRSDRVPARRRRGYRKGRVARLHQRYGWFSETRRVDGKVAQEPDAHVWPERQPASPEPVRSHRLPTGTRWVSSQGPVRSLRPLVALESVAHNRLRLGEDSAVWRFAGLGARTSDAWRRTGRDIPTTLDLPLGRAA